MDKIEKLIKGFETNFFTLDDGAILSQACSCKTIDDPDNEVVYVGWKENGLDYSVVFTERGLENAEEIKEDGSHSHFVIEDSEGYPTKVKFFSVTPINPLIKE